MDFLRQLFSPQREHPLDAAPSTAPAPIPPINVPLPDPVHPRVLAIIHNPIMPDGRRIQQTYGWNDPDKLAREVSADLREVSYGYVNYEIVERIEVDGFPIKRDGFHYTPESFAEAWRSRKFHQPDAVDYHALVRDFGMIERINADQIDEVWLFGFPYCGYYELIMAGPDAFWCNAPALKGTEEADRRFVIMGFNYERGVGEMLEDFGHRAESMMSKVFENWRTDSVLREIYAGIGDHVDLWEQFTRYDQVAPGRAECGNVHFAPNSTRDYDWGNRRTVFSRADNWYFFPDLTADPRPMNCAEWGDGDIRAHHRWWLRHFPHVTGESDGVAHNWWRYVIDPNTID